MEHSLVLLAYKAFDLWSLQMYPVAHIMPPTRQRISIALF